MRNYLNEAFWVNPGTLWTNCKNGFMKCIKTTAKQVWLYFIRRTMRLPIQGYYHKSFDCFEYPPPCSPPPPPPKKTCLNQATQKLLAKFSYPKKFRNRKFQTQKSFDHPRRLKSGVFPEVFLPGKSIYSDLKR